MAIAEHSFRSLPLLSDRPLLERYLDQKTDSRLLQTIFWVIQQAESQLKQVDNLKRDDIKTDKFRGRYLTDIKQAVRVMIYEKASHTGDVLIAMWDIVGGREIEQSLEDLKDFEFVEKIESLLGIAITHDVARFQQALHGTFSDRRTFDHGERGKQTFKNSLQMVQLWKGTLSRKIENAIGEHNQKNITEEDEHTLMIRDADKLALYRAGDYYCDIDLETLPDEERPVSNELLDTFLRGELISHHLISSDADMVVARLAWIFDLNYLNTRRLVVSERHLTNMLELLERVTGTKHKKQYVRIEKRVNEWLVQNELAAA